MFDWLDDITSLFGDLDPALLAELDDLALEDPGLLADPFGLDPMGLSGLPTDIDISPFSPPIDGGGDIENPFLMSDPLGLDPMGLSALPTTGVGASTTASQLMKLLGGGGSGLAKMLSGLGGALGGQPGGGGLSSLGIGIGAPIQPIGLPQTLQPGTIQPGAINASGEFAPIGAAPVLNTGMAAPNFAPIGPVNAPPSADMRNLLPGLQRLMMGGA